MIRNEDEAKKYQAKRAKAGKRGYAKAVRRWMKRTGDFRARERLPVNW